MTETEKDLKKTIAEARVEYTVMDIPIPPGGVLQPAEYRFSEGPCEIEDDSPVNQSDNP